MNPSILPVFVYPSILPDLTFHDPTPDLTSQNIKQPYKSLKTTPVFQITKSFPNRPIQPQQNPTSHTHQNATSPNITSLTKPLLTSPNNSKQISTFSNFSSTSPILTQLRQPAYFQNCQTSTNHIQLLLLYLSLSHQTSPNLIT